MSNQPSTDKEQRFIQMKESLRENERMICFKIKNEHAHPIEIGVEPRGLYDTIPAKTTWEYIGIVSLKDEEDLVIQIDDHDKIIIWDEARSEIFDDKGNPKFSFIYKIYSDMAVDEELRIAEKPQTEKEKCLARMRKNLEENEHIIRIKIQNDRSTALGIAAEPLGLGDTIPANTIWEYIGIIRSLNKDFAIEFDDKNYFTIWDDAQSGIFDENGGRTLIEYLPSH